jgi:membrane protein DedA with SNARE-associated domain/rhodanese-related sulfurtransferase
VASAPDLLAQYGVAVVFLWAFAVQAGVPAPAVPMLLGAGALSGSGQLNLALVIGAAMAAAASADLLWYGLGRAHGAHVLGTLCRFSLDPDTLIRHAKERFAAHRARYLVVAKFLPGVNPLAAGLAGVMQTRLDRFLFYAVAGSLLWAGIWIALGYLCADVIALLASTVAPLGRPLIAIVAGGLIVYILFKYVQRHRFLRHLQKARVTPTELRRRLEAGDRLVIVDLRTALDLERMPYRIPDARWIPPGALDAPHQLFSKDDDVVFYCAEPREATSARLAMLLAAHGYKHVHPLSGGLEGWRQAGFDLEPVSAQPPERGGLGDKGGAAISR